MRVTLDARVMGFPGISRFISGLWLALESLGTDVVGLWGTSQSTQWLGEHHPGAAGRHVSLRARPFLPWEQVSVPMAVRRLQADVHHATHFNVPYATRAPIVLTVYDLILFLNPGMARSRAAGAYYRAMLPLAVRRANVVVAASPFTAGQLTETFGVERDKLRVIEVGLDHGRWNARPAAETLTVRAAYGLPSEFLLYVGTTKTHKNLSTLLAAHRSEHPPLVLVGPTSEELASLGVTAGASGRVIALGRVPDDALPAIYTSALALVCPSLAEGVGLPPLEAMACGTPTVVSNGGALPETVGDAGLVVPARDTEAWTAALSEITDNQTLRDRLTSGGRAWVANRDWCRTARQYIDVYHDVASA